MLSLLTIHWITFEVNWSENLLEYLLREHFNALIANNTLPNIRDKLAGEFNRIFTA